MTKEETEDLELKSRLEQIREHGLFRPIRLTLIKFIALKNVETSFIRTFDLRERSLNERE
jgi:hypothetical protein